MPAVPELTPTEFCARWPAAERGSGVVLLDVREDVELEIASVENVGAPAGVTSLSFLEYFEGIFGCSSSGAGAPPFFGRATVSVPEFPGPWPRKNSTKPSVQADKAARIRIDLMIALYHQEGCAAGMGRFCAVRYTKGLRHEHGDT